MIEEKLEINEKTRKWLLNMLIKGVDRNRIIYLVETVGTTCDSCLDGIYIENHVVEEGSGIINGT